MSRDECDLKGDHHGESKQAYDLGAAGPHRPGKVGAVRSVQTAQLQQLPIHQSFVIGTALQRM